MGFWDFLSSSTPGGVAASTAKAVTDSLFGGVDKIIRDFKAPPEAILQLESLKAEIEAKVRLAVLNDVGSARSMESATQSWMPAVLTSFYTIAFIGMSSALLYMSYFYPETQLNAFQAGMIGAVWGALAKEAALGSTFYLGTSNSSSEKNDTISNLVQQAGSPLATPGSTTTTTTTTPKEGL